MSWRVVVSGLLVSILAMGVAGGQVGIWPADHHRIVPPQGQCYQGVAVSMYDTFEADFAGFQKAVGKDAAVLHWFTQALNDQGRPTDWAAQQRKFLARCREMNRIPCINYGFQSDKGVFAGFDAYTQGRMDKHLKGMADALREHGGPVLLAINHEMNGNWYPWSADRKHSSEEAEVAGRSDASSQLKPEEVFKGYIESWRYVHRFLRKEGCGNVAFCFVVGSSAYANTQKHPHHFSRYYPGDEYVDWLGFDTYNGTPPEALEQLTVELEKLAKGRPLIVKEWGTSAARAKQYLGGRDQYPGDGKWVREFFGLVERHPSIRVVTYFHRGAAYKITRDGGEETLKAYREEIARPRYLSSPLVRQP